MSKETKLKRLADVNGIYRILALDHISTLRDGLLEMTGINQISDSDLLRIKEAVIASLKKEISGILLDPHTFSASQDSLPADIGALIKLENGWVDGANKRERLTLVNETWTIERIASTKSVGIKLMLYHRPDASDETNTIQKKLVERIGEECRRFNIIFCLEPMWYPMLDDEVSANPESARNLAQRRPGFVIDSLRDFAHPQYCVDLFKLEFPANLEFTKEYIDAQPNDESVRPLYDLNYVKYLCREIGMLASVPWTIMSSGVSNSTFIKYIRLCKAGQVNGYICGQAIWKNAVRAYPDFQAVNYNLLQEAIPNIQRINEVMNMT